MKFFLLSLFLFGSLEFSKAAEVDGYYITKMNDTVHTKLYIPSLYGQILIGIQDKIEVLDTSSSKKIKCHPDDILGFAFEYKGYKYVYVSEHFDNEPGFYERKIHNNNFSLYQIAYPGGAGPNQVVYLKYIIAKNDSLYIVVPHENADKTRARLKEFFTDPAIQQYIEEKFRYRVKIERDIYDFVKYINDSN
jgi:hypothetical protein